MAGDAQLREQFPQVDKPLPENGFTGDTVKDALSAIPPAMRKSFEAIAKESREEPCKIQAEAGRIYKGLQDGTLTYKGINADDSGVVELQSRNGDTIKMHGPHISAMIEHHGEDAVGSLLENKLPPKGQAAAISGFSATMTGTMLDPLISNPEVKKVLPVHPDASRCGMV